MATVDQMKRAVYLWLAKALGKENIFKITFDSDFVAGNLIDGSFAGEPIDQVAFDTDHDTTILELADKIQKTAAIFQCVRTGARELTCAGTIPAGLIAIVGPTVQGGLSQPVATIEQIQDPESVQVIYGYQRFPSPKKSMAYFWPTSETTYGARDAFHGFDPSGMFQMGGMRAQGFTVQCIGPGALQYAKQARRALNKDTVLERFSEDFGMAFIDAEPINDLTGFLETEPEERAQFDLRFGHYEKYLDEGSWIETVKVKADIEPNVHFENIYELMS